MAGKNKSENKTVVEKAKPTLSPKRQSEDDHRKGLHSVMMEQRGTGAQVKTSLNDPLCGFCQRNRARLAN